MTGHSFRPFIDDNVTLFVYAVVLRIPSRLLSVTWVGSSSKGSSHVS